MSQLETWLHDYRKLYRDDPLKFSTQSHNFTDSQLKFQRNYLFILKKKYLLANNKEDGTHNDNLVEMMDIVEHLIKINDRRRWNLLENDGFILVK